MKMTEYFEKKILIKRPYLRLEWIEQVLHNPVRIEVQPEGRIRYWGYVHELQKYLRVVTLADGETIHNAFPDRNFKEIETQ